MKVPFFPLSPACSLSLFIRSRSIPQILAERLALYFQAYTLYSSVRPFGLSAIVAGWDSPISIEGSDSVVERKAEGKPSLYMVEPSGTFWVRFIVFPLCDKG
jgi:20S proteasome alpha/beta subunit